ncbi:hypothetical protein [Vulcanisaeta distributa]|uniref:TM1812 family CRISPR-associated protein n=1 Tax=Vulcanisaeta distributa TaxID=164451 RepID=UPI0006D14E6D|nr:hypothetical protein [Vulcanisaeta distributa]
MRLSDLMRHRLIGKLSDVAEVIIRDELNDMYKVIDKAVKLGIKVYGNYYSDIMALMHHEGFHDQCACRGGDEDKRNFIAHAGLLKNCTRIISYNNEYCIMIDDEALKCLQ